MVIWCLVPRYVPSYVSIMYFVLQYVLHKIIGFFCTMLEIFSIKLILLLFFDWRFFEIFGTEIGHYGLVCIFQPNQFHFVHIN